MQDDEQPAGPPETQDQQGRLLSVLGRLLPLVDGLTAKLRNVLILCVLLLGWIAVWLMCIQGLAFVRSLIILTVAALPLLLILRFWWALADLKALPRTANRMLADAGGQVQVTLQNLSMRQALRLGAITSAKGLWSVGALASEARERLGSYVNFGILLNPLALGLGVSSLLFVAFLLATGSVLEILTVL